MSETHPFKGLLDFLVAYSVIDELDEADGTERID